MHDTFASLQVDGIASQTTKGKLHKAKENWKSVVPISCVAWGVLMYQLWQLAASFLILRIVEPDFKPSNILIKAYLHPLGFWVPIIRLTDFGRLKFGVDKKRGRPSGCLATEDQARAYKPG